MILLALASVVAVALSNLNGLAIGDDGVGYRAIADSLLAGNGFGYFLERPVTIWPPLWPALMAVVAKVTPFGPPGATVVLNCITVVLATVVGHRLLRRLVDSDLLVFLGTAVIALGSSTIGFGHLLMTDFAFAVVVMAWLLCLMNFRDTGKLWWLLSASAWVWVGFGLRYVAIVLIATGGLWLLLDQGRSFGVRLRNGVVYGLVGIVFPLAWMARNHSVDGTLTGERFSSARGLVANAFDILSTMGKFLLPGVLNGADKIWAVVAVVVLAGAAWLGWKVLTNPPATTERDTPLRRFWLLLGGSVGLVLLHVGIYLVYMLYTRDDDGTEQPRSPSAQPRLLRSRRARPGARRPTPRAPTRVGEPVVDPRPFRGDPVGRRQRRPRSGRHRRLRGGQQLLLGQLRRLHVPGGPRQQRARRHPGRVPRVLQPAERPVPGRGLEVEPPPNRSGVH